MHIKGFCSHEDAAIVAAADCVRAVVRGRDAIVRAGTWQQVNEKVKCNYLVAEDMTVPPGARNFAVEGVPSASGEVATIIENVSWDSWENGE